MPLVLHLGSHLFKKGGFSPRLQVARSDFDGEGEPHRDRPNCSFCDGDPGTTKHCGEDGGAVLQSLITLVAHQGLNADSSGSET